jgi:hypothetical protein
VTSALTPTAGIARPGLRNVAHACFECFRCFVHMFQVLHADVAKVDQDVAYVAMIAHVCCKCLFPMFHLFFFRRMLQMCLSGCCICFTYILQVFYLDVAYVCNCLSCVFACVSGAYYECFSCFVCILQLFHLSVSKVDQGVVHVAMSYPQWPAATAGTLCMEGSGVAGVEERGKQGNVGKWCGRPRLCVHQALAWASERQCCRFGR